MGNLDLYNKVKSVPEKAKKTIGAGRTKGFTDINPMWRIKVLTEEFGPCGFGWYYTVEKKWTETVGNETCAFVDISLFVKIGDEWSKPIHGTGGSRLATSERSGVHVSDECYKMATTDAISVACKQLGIGADVYWDKDKTKYDCKQDESMTLEEKCKKESINIIKVLHHFKTSSLSELTERQVQILYEYWDRFKDGA